MTDYDSSLPIRTENAGDAAVKLVDATNTSQAVAVDADGKLKSLLYGNNGTSDVVLPIDATSGAVKVDVGATAIAVELDAADDSVQVYGHDGTNLQPIKTDASGNVLVDLPNNDESNPVYVQQVVAPSPSVTPVHKYGTQADVAKDNTYTLVHTVTAGKTFVVKDWGASGSGKIKAVFQIETAAGAGTFNTYEANFNSSSSPNCGRNFAEAFSVAAGVKVQVVVTNRDSTQDLYAWFNGYEV